MPVSTNIPGVFDSRSQMRMLYGCVAVSIALHSAVLWLFPGMREAAPAAAAVKVLTATLAPRAAAPEPAIPQEVVPPPPPKAEPPRPRPEPKPVPEAAKPALSRPAPEASAPRVPEPPPAPATPAPVAPPPVAQPAPSTPAPSQASQVQATAPPSAAGPPAAQPKAADAPDAGNLDQYRLALIGAARKYKRYPAQAMEKGWAGKVEVRLVIGPNGMIQSALVKNSSGYDILDNQALDMVRKAKPLTPIPPALRGKEFTVDIPVIFDLQTG